MAVARRLLRNLQTICSVLELVSIFQCSEVQGSFKEEALARLQNTWPTYLPQSCIWFIGNRSTWYRMRISAHAHNVNRWLNTLQLLPLKPFL